MVIKMHSAPTTSYKKLAFCQCLIAAVLILCLTCLPFSFFIKFFVDIFSTGRSNFKIIFFLGFVFVTLVFRYFRPASIPRFLPLLNLVLATTLFAFGVVEFFIFSNAFFADPQHITHAQYFESISSTRLYHTHNAKTVMAWVLQWFPHSDLSQYDFGLPYFYFYPNWLLGLHSLLYIAFFILTLYQLAAYERLSLGVYALFVMSCFIVLRNQLDGGLFFCEPLAAFPIYCVIQWRLWRQTKTVSPTAALGIPIIILLTLVTLAIFLDHYTSEPWFSDSPLRYLSLCAFLFTVYAVFNAIEMHKPLRALGMTAAFIFTFMLMAYSGLYESWGAYQFGFIVQKIEGNFTATIPDTSLARVQQNAHFTILKLTKVGDIDLVTARPKSPIYLWQLHKEWGIYINYASIDVHDNSYCNADHSYTTQGVLYVLSSKHPLANLKKTYGDIVFELTPIKSDLPYNKYTLRLVLPGCTPDRIELLKVILNDLGIERSVIKVDLIDIG